MGRELAPHGPHLSQLTCVLDPKLCFSLFKTHSLADISGEVSGDQRAGRGPGVEVHGDQGGHVTEQAKSQARTRSARGLPAWSGERPWGRDKRE